MNDDDFQAELHIIRRRIDHIQWSITTLTNIISTIIILCAVLTVGNFVVTWFFFGRI